jgi:hypothetical protein
VDDSAVLERRVSTVWLSMVPQGILVGVLFGLAAIGVPAVGFVVVVLLVPLMFTPKVARDLAAIRRIVATGTQTAVKVEVRSDLNPSIPRIKNVWADLFAGDSGRPLVTIPIGAPLSGVPSKRRALTLASGVSADAIGVVQAGHLVVLRIHDGLLLPSGPAKAPRAR